MKSITAVVVAALCPHMVTAQNPGQRVTVSVQTTSVVARGDTIGVTSIVANLGASQESLVDYFVDAPGGVVVIHTPTPDLDWMTLRDFRSRPMATWTILTLLPPGSSTPPLYFESVGLPGIVTYWAGGEYELPPGDDIMYSDSNPIPDPLVTRMIAGKTVGVETFPTDRSPQGLIARLRVLTQTACSAPLFWVSNASLCSQLISDIDQVEAHRLNGQIIMAKDVLTHYETLLTDGSVSNAGYWLLKSNAAIIYTSL